MRRRFVPIHYAFVCAVVYGVAAALWIYFSSSFAKLIASDVQELAAIEAYKGFFFVFITTSLLFMSSLQVFKRFAKNAAAMVQGQQRLVQAERDSLARLVSSAVAHDFSNLLTVFRVHLERLKANTEMPKAAKDSIERLDLSTIRLTELAQRMRQIGRSVGESKPVLYEVDRMIEEILWILKTHEKFRGCTIDLDLRGEIKSSGYPVLIHQLLMNLLLNAAEATLGHGRIILRARREDDLTWIEVEDDGPGIPPEFRERVFDPFFTTKKSGSGLGLMSVQSCVVTHGGSISIGESSLGGALFRVVLPDVVETPKASVPAKSSTVEQTYKGSESLTKTFDSPAIGVARSTVSVH